MLSKSSLGPVVGLVSSEPSLGGTVGFVVKIISVTCPKVGESGLSSMLEYPFIYEFPQESFIVTKGGLSYPLPPDKILEPITVPKLSITSSAAAPIPPPPNNSIVGGPHLNGSVSHPIFVVGESPIPFPNISMS